MPVLQPTGEYLALFDGRSLKGWFPRRGQWDVEVDDEKVKVLAGTGLIALPFDGHERYRLTLGLDVHTAAAAEVQFGLPDGRPASQALRYGLQISKAGGARLGTRVGDGGAFQPQGPAIPFPAIERLADRRPYLEVKIERAGSWWAVWFDGREVGRGDSAGQPWVGEIRLAADSGRVRVDSAVLAMLRE